MSLRSPNFRYDKQGTMPDYDRIMAPVPLRRGQPVVGYAGMTARIDGTIAASQWSCMCGGSPNAPAYGIKYPENSIVDPTRAYFSTVNCTGQPAVCDDPLALTGVPQPAPGQVGEQLACVYRNATARESCTEARTPATGCFRYPGNHSHA